MNQFQEAVSSSVNPLLKLPILDGTLIENISLATVSPTISLKVPHNLGRQPIGWMVVDKNASANVWRVSWSETTIELKATATVTISIWVF